MDEPTSKQSTAIRQPSEKESLTGSSYNSFVATDSGSNAASSAKMAGQTISIGRAVGIAITRHPRINKQSALIARSESDVSIAKSAQYPTLEYGVTPSYTRSSDIRSRSGTRGTVGVSQLLYDFGRTQNRIKGSYAVLEHQKYLLREEIEAVAHETALTFVKLAAAQDIIAKAARQAEKLKELNERIKERVAAGLSDQTDAIQAQVAVLRADADSVKAKTDFDVAAGEISELIGYRPSKVLTLSKTSSFVAGLKSPDPNIDAAPTVLSAQSAVQAADLLVKTTKAERYPSINANARHSIGTSNNSNNDDSFIGVSLNGNFSFGGLEKNKVAAAEFDKVAAIQTLENAKLSTRSSLASAQTEATGALSRIAAYDETIRLSVESRDLYWQEYTLNKRPLTEVLNAEREIYTLEVEKIRSLSDNAVALIRAQVAMGQFVDVLANAERRGK